MKKRRAFEIGDCILVYNTMQRSKQGDVIEWKKGAIFTKPRLAQITGLCKRYDGNTEDTYCDTEFISTKTHTFWLVRFGLMNKEVPVCEENITPTPAHMAKDLPTLYPRPSMSERYKQALREDSVHWPRNSKGQWVAGPNVY